MKNKLILISILILLALPLLMAETETYKVNEEVELNFICTLNNAIPSASAKYLFTVNYPNGSIFLNNYTTEALGNGAFFNTTTFKETGLYKVQMFCYDGIYSYAEEGFYDITPTGIIQTSILENPLLIILGLLGLGLVIFGAVKGIPWFGFIGSIMFLLLGLYTMIYGFNNTTDLYTRGVAITFLGMGIIFMFAAAYEWLYSEATDDD